MSINTKDYSTLKNIKKIQEKIFYEKYSTKKKELFNYVNSGGLRKKNLFKASENNKPLVSIITICLNSEKTLEKSIQSVLNQSYDNIEYLIIDGCSTDKSLEIINSYGNFIDLWISQKDDGIYDAMNKGILLSSGKIIGILNADDEYTKDAVKLAKEYFSTKKIDFLFGSVKKDRLLSGFHQKKINWKFNIYPAHSSGFFITQKAQLISGLYDQNFPLHADYDLIFRLIKKFQLNGIAMNREHVTGIFNEMGKSSQESKLNYFFEEFKIRKKNNQNIFFISLLFLIKIIYLKLFKIPYLKKFFHKLRKLINY